MPTSDGVKTLGRLEPDPSPGRSRGRECHSTGPVQSHNSKASILQCSAFVMVQLSHPYMTTRKTIALTRQTFVGKVMSLLFAEIAVGPGEEY